MKTLIALAICAAVSAPAFAQAAPAQPVTMTESLKIAIAKCAADKLTHTGRGAYADLQGFKANKAQRDAAVVACFNELAAQVSFKR